MAGDPASTNGASGGFDLADIVGCECRRFLYPKGWDPDPEDET